MTLPLIGDAEPGPQFIGVILPELWSVAVARLRIPQRSSYVACRTHVAGFRRSGRRRTRTGDHLHHIDRNIPLPPSCCSGQV